MHIRDALQAVVSGRDLTTAEMLAVTRQIMAGEATAAQIGGFLVALRMKGETVDELTAAATVMRELSIKVTVDVRPLVDTCGTGGDGVGTFNISTAATFVVAAAGGYVAKHGNRSVSSASGSADVLEAAGARIALDPEQIAACIVQTGVGFMFAPVHHGAMRHAGAVRRELGIRTLFNALGPLTNPAGAPAQVMGVFAPAWVPIAAQALVRLGTRRALVVHAEDGLDEISIGAKTRVAEIGPAGIRSYTIDPADFGIRAVPLAALRAVDAEDSLRIMRAVYANEPGPARDIVALNAGAAIYVADLADTLVDGTAEARRVIASGAAAERFARFVEFTRRGAPRADG